ncbi:unnamed protein product [Parajaminaea phylloscopi]
MSDPATSWPVSLYVYDLSGGLARQLSGALLGRQFDAVFHTSIVVHGREHFFGQGISITAPGSSHHGRPMEIIELGVTEIDRETWAALLDDLRARFTPSAYNLMSFNCNTFSNECANILVGTDIPAHILSLPSDFQTALGDMTSRRQGGDAGNRGAFESPLLGILNQIGTRAGGSTEGSGGQSATLASVPSAPSSSTPRAANLFSVAQSAELDAILSQWPAAAVLFTNTRTCPPCKVIHPVFEALAAEYAPGSPKAGLRRIAFVVVDSSPASMALMSAHSIRGTPTFKFFTGRTQRHQFSGADAAELRSQVDLSLFDVYKNHPHISLQPLASLKDVPRSYILAATCPNFPSALRTLDEAIAAIKVSDFNTKADIQDARKVIAKDLIPWLESHFVSGENKSAKRPLSLDMARKWHRAVKTLNPLLKPASIYPLLDFARLATADHESMAIASQAGILDEMIRASSTSLGGQDGATRPVWLTTLRLLGNLIALCGRQDAVAVGNASACALVADHKDTFVESWMMEGLGHADKSVRNAAASVAFNLALWRSQDRSTYLLRSGDSINDGSQDARPTSSYRILGDDFEMDTLPCLVEAIKNEKESADVLHRLLAAVLLLLYLHPQSVDVQDLLLVLEAPDILQSHIGSDLVKSSEKSTSIVAICKDINRIVDSKASD